jgi:hypothetical protein
MVKNTMRARRSTSSLSHATMTKHATAPSAAPSGAAPPPKVGGLSPVDGGMKYPPLTAINNTDAKSLKARLRAIRCGPVQS